VTSFDGDHYQVYYPEDDDEEEMSEWEFDDLEITHKPFEVVQEKAAEEDASLNEGLSDTVVAKQSDVNAKKSKPTNERRQSNEDENAKARDAEKVLDQKENSQKEMGGKTRKRGSPTDGTELQGETTMSLKKSKKTTSSQQPAGPASAENLTVDETMTKDVPKIAATAKAKKKVTASAAIQKTASPASAKTLTVDETTAKDAPKIAAATKPKKKVAESAVIQKTAGLASAKNLAVDETSAKDAPKIAGATTKATEKAPASAAIDPIADLQHSETEQSSTIAGVPIEPLYPVGTCFVKVCRANHVRLLYGLNYFLTFTTLLLSA